MNKQGNRNPMHRIELIRRNLRQHMRPGMMIVTDLTAHMRILIIGLMSGVLLSACTETSNTSMSPSPSAMRTGSSTDEQACLDAVAAQANTTVSIISSEFSEANTLVMVGVGPQNAPWRCLVSKGVVAEAMFAGSEGNL
jgi:hypothetical protein